jgi:hypothetical protein
MVLVFALASTSLSWSAVARALSQSELYSIYSDTTWYDPNSSASSACTATDTSPGNGAPDGAQFPNLDPSAMANAINQWIVQQNPNSEMKGLGSTIVADGKSSNVSPFLIVAIAKSESSIAAPGDWNVAHANNSFGREATSSQPNVPSPSRDVLWYKWSTVKASVDNTAPENQNAAGGGDMATYLRTQFGSQIDDNNLVAMITKYAPPKENDTAQYIANVQSWISDLIKLTGGTTSGSGSTNAADCVASGCTIGASGVSAILCEAEKYEGIYYQFGGGHEAYSTFRQICPEEALPNAAAASTLADPGPCATDCSGLVSVAVDSAFNLSYVWSIDNSMVGEGSQYWQSIPIDQASAGDIVTTAEHVEIVDHIQGSTVYTFGSHETGTKTGNVTTSKSYWTGGAYHWTGPGSS